MTSDAGPSSTEVAEMFEQVARALASDTSVEATLDAIVRLAVEHLPACEFAGITMIVDRVVTSPASSHETPRILDAIQAEVDEGPCLDAIAEHQVFRTGDLTKETRWPRFAERAHRETGVTSIVSFRLFIEQDTMGALNLYATAVDAFDDTDVALGAVFAAHAAVALSSAQREEQLERKAASRDLIGQAKGILMAQSHIDEDAAFDLLRRASQRLNIKLTHVAEGVVHPPDQPDHAAHPEPTASDGPSDPPRPG